MARFKFLLLVLIAVIYHSNTQVIHCDNPAGTCSCETQQQYIGTTCELRCVGKGVCKDAIVRCRSGDACIVTCSGEDACIGNTNIYANDATDFTLICEGDSNTCENAEAECGTGKCALECNNYACDGLVINTIPSTQAFKCTGDCPTNIPAEFTMAPTIPPTNTPTATPSTSNPTTSIPTTSIPTTSIPITNNPTSSSTTTSEPSTSNPTTSAATSTILTSSNSDSSSTVTAEPNTSNAITTKSMKSKSTVTRDGDNDNVFIITIEGNDIDNLKQDKIEAIIINALGISGDDIIFTKWNNDSIVISISTSSDVSLEEDTIKQNVEHGLEEYGGDLQHLSVTVSKAEDDTSDTTKHPLSIFVSDIKVLIITIAAVCIVIICCISLIIFYRNQNEKNKTLQDQKALSMSVKIEANSPTINSKHESMDYVSSAEMQPVEMDANANNLCIVAQDDSDVDDELYDDKHTENVTTETGYIDTKTSTKVHYVNDTIGDITKLPAFQEEGENESDDELYDIQPVQNTQTSNITRNDDDKVMMASTKGNDNTPQQETVYID